MTLHVPNRLKLAIDNDPAKCILLVGSGLSTAGVREGGGGLPDWDTLIRRMIDDLADANCCSQDEISSLRKAQDEGKHLQVAEFYRSKTRPDQFAEFLRSQLDPSDLCASPLHETILRTGFRGIISLNFDRVFEKSSDRVEPLVYPHCIGELDWFRRHGFFAKMHGCIHTPGDPATNLVFTEDSYIGLRANRRYQTILQSLLVMHPLLTVGFSLRDPDFLAWMDDLGEVFGDSLPTVYSLMLDPGTAARDTWRQRGVEIVPYIKHEEVASFFAELENMRVSRPRTHYALSTSQPDFDIGSVLESWDSANKTEELYAVVEHELQRIPRETDKETFLFRLTALLDPSDVPAIIPHLLNVATDSCLFLADRILSDHQRGAWSTLKPHLLHIPTYEWVLKKYMDSDVGYESFNKWLLDSDWTPCGVDLWSVFEKLLHRALKSTYLGAIGGVYEACEGVEGAREHVREIVLSPGFIPIDSTSDPRRGLRAKILGEQLVAELGTGEDVRYSADYRALLQRALLLDSEVSDPYFRSTALERLLRYMLDEYTQRMHVTLHGFSGLYDPARAKEIREALAEIEDPQVQKEVMWAIRRWRRDREGLISRGEDYARLTEGLLVPLWWRYSSEVRTELIAEEDHHRMMDGRETNGHDLLLGMMGLSYDPDRDFQAAHDAAASECRVLEGATSGYSGPLADLWRRRKLSYCLAEGVPPELVRRYAARPAPGDNLKDVDKRWQEAEALCLQPEQDEYHRLMAHEAMPYVIDDLLGSYDPTEAQVSLYLNGIHFAAWDLGIDEQALSSVVYIHMTVHAFSHLGKDLNGRVWNDFSLPAAREIDSRPSMPHESIAQFYTFQLLKYLDDAKLLKAFHVLEENCAPEYKAWRQTETYSLEQMRQILVMYRDKAQEWPPVRFSTRSFNEGG